MKDRIIAIVLIALIPILLLSHFSMVSISYASNKDYYNFTKPEDIGKWMKGVDDYQKKHWYDQSKWPKSDDADVWLLLFIMVSLSLLGISLHGIYLKWKDPEKYAAILIKLSGAVTGQCPYCNKFVGVEHKGPFENLRNRRPGGTFNCPHCKNRISVTKGGNPQYLKPEEQVNEGIDVEKVIMETVVGGDKFYKIRTLQFLETSLRIKSTAAEKVIPYEKIASFVIKEPVASKFNMGEININCNEDEQYIFSILYDDQLKIAKIKAIIKDKIKLDE